MRPTTTARAARSRSSRPRSASCSASLPPCSCRAGRWPSRSRCGSTRIGGRRAWSFHPTCHLELHEDKAYQRLHGLIGRTVGDGERLITLADLEAVHEPLAALLIELPQREIGGRLPAWDDLVAQIAWAAGPRGGRAPRWRTTVGVQALLRPPAGRDRRAFDTVYVSFYKGLGGRPAACCWARRTSIAEAREWRNRHGGTLFQPVAVRGVRPRGAAHAAAADGRVRRHARAIASAPAVDERRDRRPTRRRRR